MDPKFITSVVAMKYRVQNLDSKTFKMLLCILTFVNIILFNICVYSYYDLQRYGYSRTKSTRQAV